VAREALAGLTGCGGGVRVNPNFFFSMSNMIGTMQELVDKIKAQEASKAALEARVIALYAQLAAREELLAERDAQVETQAEELEKLRGVRAALGGEQAQAQAPAGGTEADALHMAAPVAAKAIAAVAQHDKKARDQIAGWLRDKFPGHLEAVVCGTRDYIPGITCPNERTVTLTLEVLREHGLAALAYGKEVRITTVDAMVWYELHKLNYKPTEEAPSQAPALGKIMFQDHNALRCTVGWLFGTAGHARLEEALTSKTDFTFSCNLVGYGYGVCEIPEEIIDVLRVHFGLEGATYRPYTKTSHAQVTVPYEVLRAWYDAQQQ
jgi:hypothetical protein